LVGSPYFDPGGHPMAGRVSLFLGGPGAATTPAWTYEGTFDNGLVGSVLSGAGTSTETGSTTSSSATKVISIRRDIDPAGRWFSSGAPAGSRRSPSGRARACSARSMDGRSVAWET